jgi:uncharacterized protein YbcI
MLFTQPFSGAPHTVRAKEGGLVSTDDQQDPTSAELHRSTLLELSNAMVRLYKDQFGRGPGRARSYWAGPDIVMCVLDDTLTRAEENLVKLGEHQRLRDTRVFFQYATIAEFCEPVERLTGRRVRAFHSSVDTEADGQSVEVFVLHPAGYDGPSRAEGAAF